MLLENGDETASRVISPAMRGSATKALCAGLLGAALLIGGCKQADGERCQISDDCSPESYCELAGNTPAMGGFCRSKTNPTTDMAGTAAPDLAKSPDLATPPDLAGTD